MLRLKLDQKFYNIQQNLQHPQNPGSILVEGALYFRQILSKREIFPLPFPTQLESISNHRHSQVAKFRIRPTSSQTPYDIDAFSPENFTFFSRSFKFSKLVQCRAVVFDHSYSLAWNGPKSRFP